MSTGGVAEPAAPGSAAATPADAAIAEARAVHAAAAASRPHFHRHHMSLLAAVADARVLGPLAAYVLLHAGTHAALRRLAQAAPWLAALTPAQTHYVSQKLPSAVHSLRGVSASLSALASVRHGSPFTSYPRLADVALADFTAFAFYGMYVMALQAREHWSAWIHHGLGVVGTALERVYRISAVLPVSFIIPEATVPASSAVWLMQRAGADKSHPCWFQAALAVRAVAFLIFRLPVPAIVAARFWAELGVHYARRVRDGAKMLVDAMPESPGVASADSTGISRAALTRLAGPDRTSGSSSSTAASSLPAAATSSPAAHEKRQHAQLTNARIAALLVDDAAHMPRIVSLLLVLNSLAFSVLNVYWSVLVIRAWWRFRPSDVAAAAAAVASVAKTAAAIHHI